MKLTFELTSGYFEYAYAMLLLQPELWLCKKIYKVQNKTRINAAYDNVKYFFSCRKIFFVKLRQGSGKDRQGMAVKAKGLKA